MRKPKPVYGAALQFLLPFFFWMFLLRDFFLGNNLIIHDTFEIYANVKYFLNSLQNGTYPLWDPFQFWGAPFEMRSLQFGPFNPFLYITLVLNSLGLGYFYAYMAYLAAYYLLGLLGFYLLAKSIFKNSLLAYTAYLLLMFSSLGMTLFSQIQMLTLFVPAVWFFYFSAEFVRCWRRAEFLGMTFCLMVILTTYVPFYFVTVLAVFAVLFAVVYFKELKKIFTGFKGFVRRNTVAVAVCAVSLAISLAVPVFVFRESRTGDYAIPSRHLDDARAIDRVLGMDYDEVAGGGVALRMTAEDLFSGFKYIDFRNDGYVFVPFFAFAVISMSLLTKLSRRSLLMLCAAFIIFLISLAEVTPVHRFLFERIFYFKLFRNLYFFLPFILAAVILFTVEQFQKILEGEMPQGKVFQAAAAALLHAAFLVFLLQRDLVPVTSYITLLGSFALFLLLIFKRLTLPKNLFWVFLPALVLLQPAEVLSGYNANSRDYGSGIIRQSLHKDRARPRFSFTRKEQRVADYENGHSERDPKFFLNWADIAMEDMPGFITYRHGYPARWAYVLSQKIPEDAYRGYVRHKFILYDRVEPVDGSNIDWDTEAVRLQSFSNTASVVSKGSEKIEQPASAVSQNATAVTGDSGWLEVLKFNANSLVLKSRLPFPKFLVYNDGFHGGWQVKVNGHKEKLYRANVAFKGVWLPAGKSTVEFIYRSKGVVLLHVFVLAYFFAFMLALIAVYAREGAHEKTS